MVALASFHPLMGMSVMRLVNAKVIISVRLATGHKFALDNDVSNLEVMPKALPNNIQPRGSRHLWCMDNMGSQTDLAAAYRPDMLIMDAEQAGHHQQRFTHLANVDFLRDAFKQDIQARFQQDPGARQHPQADTHRHDRVHPTPSS